MASWAERALDAAKKKKKMSELLLLMLLQTLSSWQPAAARALRIAQRRDHAGWPLVAARRRVLMIRRSTWFHVAGVAILGRHARDPLQHFHESRPIVDR